jgi:hypothetical protein
MSVNNRMHELLEFFKTNPPPEEVYERYYAEDVVVQEKYAATACWALVCTNADIERNFLG